MNTRKLNFSAGVLVLRGLAPCLLMLLFGSGCAKKQALTVTKEVPWVNSLGMKFVPVPDTQVLFCIWETRVQDYQVFFDTTKRNWPKSDIEQPLTHPAVNVSWEDAKAFCEWLTQKERSESRLRADQVYRLPTDAEWSVAVGLNQETGGTPLEKEGKIKNVYPWGSQWPPPRGAGNYSQTLGTDDYPYIAPVGMFAPNEFGLHDMGGNVWEWCEDRYDAEQRVVRGGSWYNPEQFWLLSSARNRNMPDSRYHDVGFRCVLTKTSVQSKRHWWQFWRGYRDS
jgi:formylglycine-generating enzyme required for sulfatase activity